MVRLKTSARIDPINRDVDLILHEWLSPAAHQQMFAEFAEEQVGEADRTNESVLGRIPRKTITVDGRRGGILASAAREVIVEYELVTDTLAWIGEQLVLRSPYKTGDYARSHQLFADGVDVPHGSVIPPAEEYVFMNAVPYARKIEFGLSSQAPDGVYQATALMASRKFGNVARIRFSYRTVVGGVIVGGKAGNRPSTRQPAIVVTLGRN